MSRSSEPEDVRLRFGMDPPRLEERAHWEELIPGADEVPVLLRRDEFPLNRAQVDLIERMFTFTISSESPEARVRCHQCGWSITGDSPRVVFRRADEHVCEPLTVDEDGEA